MFNKVILIGHLSKDVEVKSLPSGSNLAVINLASNRKGKKANGDDYEEVLFIEVKIFGKLAEVAGKYLNRGSKVLIEGYLKLESWNDKEGKTKQKHTIIAEKLEMLGGSDKKEKQAPAKKGTSHKQQVSNDNDDLPF